MTPDPAVTARRWFLQQCGLGVGAAALTGLLAQDGYAADPLAPKTPHFAPKAKRVIYLFQSGGPSHLDLFDYKPKLDVSTARICPHPCAWDSV